MQINRELIPENKVEQIVRAFNLRRFHAELIEGDTVGCHSLVAALLVTELLEHEPINTVTVLRELRLVKAAIRHDMGEFYSGDIPAPFKMAMTDEMKFMMEDLEQQTRIAINANYPELNNEDEAILFLADKLSGLIHTIYRITKGETAGVVIADRWVSYLYDFALQAEKVGLICADTTTYVVRTMLEACDYANQYVEYFRLLRTRTDVAERYRQLRFDQMVGRP